MDTPSDPEITTGARAQGAIGRDHLTAAHPPPGGQLDRYRRALEAGTDPAVVAAWIREVTEIRRRTEREVHLAAPAPLWGREELRALVEALGDLVGVLRTADPAKKAELYGGLGLALTYDPNARRVTVEADLAMCRDRVGGGI
ncbi:MAG: hypothetical protein KatS3mg013_0504 [Actinomycetota bacterium]|nr:MAG: hypothetical protein KatS3mg013_0504 [Actinomycetota bacterium]